jgi:hypothetical protein
VQLVRSGPGVVRRRDRRSLLAGPSRMPGRRDSRLRPILRRHTGGHQDRRHNLRELPGARAVLGVRGADSPTARRLGWPQPTRAPLVGRPRPPRTSAGQPFQREQDPLQVGSSVRPGQHLLRAERGAALPHLPPRRPARPRPAATPRRRWLGCGMSATPSTSTPSTRSC